MKRAVPLSQSCRPGYVSMPASVVSNYQATMGVSSDGVSVTHHSAAPLRFPSTKSILWDHRPTSSPIMVHLTEYRNLMLTVEEKTLRLAHRYAQETDLDEYYCVLHGVSSVETDGSGMAITIDRFETLPSNHEMSISLNDLNSGEVTIPCVIHKNSAKPTSSTEQYSQMVKLLHERCTSNAKVDPAHFVSLCANCSCYSKRQNVIFHIDFDSITLATKFKMTPINAVPIIMTALSKNLMSPMSITEIQGEAKSGYLTMDHTRKLLLVLECDPKIAKLPTVGIWVSGVSNIHDPHVWGCALRYLHNTRLQERVCRPPEPFLIVLFSPLHSKPEFYDCITHNGSMNLDFGLSSCNDVIQLPKECLSRAESPLELELLRVECGDKNEHFHSALSSLQELLKPKQRNTVSEEGRNTFEEIMPRLKPTPYLPQVPMITPSVPEVSLLFDDLEPRHEVPQAVGPHNSPQAISPPRPYPQSHGGMHRTMSVPEGQHVGMWKPDQHHSAPNSPAEAYGQPHPMLNGHPGELIYPTQVMQQQLPSGQGARMMPQKGPQIQRHQGGPSNFPPTSYIHPETLQGQYQVQSATAPSSHQQMPRIGQLQGQQPGFRQPAPQQQPKVATQPQSVQIRHPSHIHPNHLPQQRPTQSRQGIQQQHMPQGQLSNMAKNIARSGPSGPMTFHNGAVPNIVRHPNNGAHPQNLMYPPRQAASQPLHHPNTQFNPCGSFTPVAIAAHSQVMQSQTSQTPCSVNSVVGNTTADTTTGLDVYGQNSGSTDSGLHTSDSGDSGALLNLSGTSCQNTSLGSTATMSQVPPEVMNLLRAQDEQLKMLRGQLAQLLANQKSAPPTNSNTLTQLTVTSETLPQPSTNSIACNTSLFWPNNNDQADQDDTIHAEQLSKQQFVSQGIGPDTPQCYSAPHSPVKMQGHHQHAPSTPTVSPSQGKNFVPTNSRPENDATISNELSLDELQITQIQDRTEESMLSEMIVDMPAYNSMSPEKIGGSSSGYADTDRSPVLGESVSMYERNLGASPLHPAQLPESLGQEQNLSDPSLLFKNQKRFYENLLGNVQQFLDHHSRDAGNETNIGVPLGESTIDPMSHRHDPDTSSNNLSIVDVAERTRKQLQKMGIDVEQPHPSDPIRTDQSCYIEAALLPKLNYVSMMLDSDSDFSADADSLAIKYLSDEQLTELAKVRMTTPKKVKGMQHPALSRLTRDVKGKSDISTCEFPVNHMSFASQKYLERYGLIGGADDDQSSQNIQGAKGKSHLQMGATEESREPSENYFNVNDFLKKLSDRSLVTNPDPSVNTVQDLTADTVQAIGPGFHDSSLHNSASGPGRCRQDRDNSRNAWDVGQPMTCYSDGESFVMTGKPTSTPAQRVHSASSDITSNRTPQRSPARGVRQAKPQNQHTPQRGSTPVRVFKKETHSPVANGHLSLSTDNVRAHNQNLNAHNSSEPLNHHAGGDMATNEHAEHYVRPLLQTDKQPKMEQVLDIKRLKELPKLL